jgi:hypothetical protein
LQNQRIADLGPRHFLLSISQTVSKLDRSGHTVSAGRIL